MRVMCINTNWTWSSGGDFPPKLPQYAEIFNVIDTVKTFGEAYRFYEYGKRWAFQCHHFIPLSDEPEIIEVEELETAL